MEILALEGIPQSDASAAVIRSGRAAAMIAGSPEDYVFVVSVDEWRESLRLLDRLSEGMRSAKTDDDSEIFLRQFADDNAENPAALIPMVCAFPGVNKYKLCNIGPGKMGGCFAVFFAKQENVNQRLQFVWRKIVQLKKEKSKEPPLS